MEREFRIGIVGSGMMGLQHAEAIRRVPGTRIVALVDRNAQRGEQICQKECIPHTYTDYRDMLRSEKPDAVHVCTPNNTHFEICQAALEAGVAVFCEKPLAVSSRQARELEELAEKRGLAAGVNFNYRQNVMVRQMHALAAAPEWGRTFLIRGEYIQDWMMYDTDYNWRCVPAVNGASRTIADIGSHWFDAVQFITGQKVKQVYARLLTVHPQRKKAEGHTKTFETQTGSHFQLVDIDTEDAAFILFEMEDGTPGTLTVSQVSAGYKNGMVISLDGQASSMTWSQENPDKLLLRTREKGTTLQYAAAGGMQESVNAYTTLPAGHAVGWADGLKNSIAAFYEHLRTGEEPRYATFAEGRYITQIVEACLKSDSLGAWVRIGE